MQPSKRKMSHTQRGLRVALGNNDSRGAGGHTQSYSPVESLSQQLNKIVRINSGGAPGWHGFGGGEMDPISSEKAQDRQRQTQWSPVDSNPYPREQERSFQSVREELQATQQPLQDSLTYNVAALLLHVNTAATQIHDLTKQNQDLTRQNEVLIQLVHHMIVNSPDAMRAFEAVVRPDAGK